MRWFRIGAAVLAAACFVYVVLRAASVSFTYDEALTYFHFVGAPFATVWLYAGEGASVNNHTLNTVLMTLASRWVGKTELALRLPNVLAFAGYAVAVWLVSRRLRAAASRALALVLLLANPFLLEIFSLARGYGLGLCFVLGGVAALAAGLDPATEERIALRRLAQGMALAGVSVVANLAFLNVFLAFSVVAVAARWRLTRGGGVGAWRSVVGSAAAVSAAVGLYAAPAIWRMQKIHGLYYGGSAGFWKDTVDSLIRCWLYVQPYAAAAKPAAWALVAVVLVLGPLILLRASRGSRPWTAPESLLGALLAMLVLGALANVFEHAFFGTPFPINRTAAWMLPIFSLAAAVEVEIAATGPSRAWRGASQIGAWVVVAACGLHAVLSANTRYAILQYHDADTKAMLRDLTELRKSAGEPPRLALRASWELAPSIEYYRVTRPLTWLEPVTEVPGPADAAFVSAKDLGVRGEMVAWKSYPITGNTLLVTRGRFPAAANSGP